MIRPMMSNSLAKFCTLAVALALPQLALADDTSDCSAGYGTLLVGTVVSAPTDVPGKALRGIPLRHTHISLRGDSDGKTYDLAVDDVFASGYQVQGDVVPAPLNTILVGQHLEACGLPYSGGMHWVHNNCGDVPTAKDPNGWLKVIGASGAVGPNLEDNEKYCYLWPKNGAMPRRRHHGGRSAY
jgi:hypothetical protein